MCLPSVIHRGHPEAIIGDLGQWHDELGAPGMRDPELESEEGCGQETGLASCKGKAPQTPTDGPGEGRLLRAFQAASLSE